MDKLQSYGTRIQLSTRDLCLPVTVRTKRRNSIAYEEYVCIP